MLNASSLEFLLRYEWNGKAVFNNPSKSKRGLTELRRDSCVSFDVYWCELWTETHCVIFVSPAVNYCRYACGSTTVTFDQYTLCTGIPLHFPRYTINILSALIFSILPHNVIAVQQKRKDRHPNRPCHCTVTLRFAPEGELNTDCVSKYRIHLGHRYTYLCF